VLHFLMASVMLLTAGAATDDATTLAVTFEKGFAPDKACAEVGLLRRGQAQLVAGRGGKVLEVARYQLGAAYSGKALKLTEGTVEFWFASRHDPAIKGKEHPAYTLWSAEARNHTGISSWIAWNRALVYRTASGYKNLTRIEDARHPLNDGKWHHMAYTWDESGMAVFIDGIPHKVSRGRMRLPPALDSALMLGCRSTDEQVETLKPVANPASAMGLFDDLRVSRAARYHARFQPPADGLARRAVDPASSVFPPSSGPSGANCVFAGDFDKDFHSVASPAAEVRLFRQGGVKIAPGHKGRGVELPSEGPMPAALAYGVGSVGDRFVGGLSLWFRPGWPKPGKRRVLAELAGVAGDGYLLAIEPDGRLAFLTCEGRKEVGGIRSRPLVWDAGRWYSITADWTTASVKLGRDGQPVGEDGPLVLPSRLGGILYVGSSSSGEPAGGVLDEVRLFTRPAWFIAK